MKNRGETSEQDTDDNPRCASGKARLYVEEPLSAGATLTLEKEQSHYLVTVLRMGAGGRVLLFNGRDGEWAAEIAEAHGRTPAQVLLRGLIQQEGVIAIPKTANPDRLEENLGAGAFSLTDNEMARIFALKRPDGRLVRMAGEPEWDT